MAATEQAQWMVSKLEKGRYVLVGVLTRDQLDALGDHMEPVSKSWRGKYQAIEKSLLATIRGAE